MNHQHILQLTLPKDLGEVCDQMKHVVNLFYDASYGDKEAGPVPCVLGIRYLLSGEGPLEALTHIVAKKLNEPVIKVGEAIISAVGLAARLRESDWIKKHLPGGYHEGITPDDIPSHWVLENVNALSFTALASEQDRLGLGGNCALCSAVYIATNYEPGKSDLNRLFTKLRSLDDCDEDKCAETILNGLIEEHGWEDVKGTWGTQRFQLPGERL